MLKTAVTSVLFVMVATAAPAAERLTYPRCDLHDWLAHGSASQPGAGGNTVRAPVDRCEATLSYTGEVRPTPEAHTQFLRELSRTNGFDTNVFAFYAHEAAFRDGSSTQWLLVLDAQLAKLRASEPAGGEFRVRLAWRGSVEADPILVVEELAPASAWRRLLGDDEHGRASLPVRG